MLEILDDDGGFEPDEAFRSAVRRRGRALRRRRRSVRAGAVAVPVVALVGAVAFTGDRLAGVDRVDVAVGGPPPMIGGAPTSAVDVLVVGTDGGLGENGRTPDDERADAVALVRLDPVAGEVRVLSLPRDLVIGVTTDGAPRNRLSQVRSSGGPVAMREVADDLLMVSGGSIDGVESYVELEPEGLAELVDLVGGVPVEVNRPTRDQGSGLALDPGCRDLDGEDVVALARARRLEVLVDDRWVADPRSDLGRVARTQLVGRALATAVLEAHPTPASIVSLLDVLSDQVTLDVETDVGTLASLAAWARALPGDAVTVATLPTVPTVTAGGANVLVPGPTSDEAVRWLVAGGSWPTDDTSTASPGPDPYRTALALPLSGGCP